MVTFYTYCSATRQAFWKHFCASLCLCLLCIFTFGALSLAHAKPPKIRLFGSIELRGKLDTLKQWTRVRKEHAGNNLFVPGAKLNSSTSWDAFKAKLMPLTPLEKIKAVHLFWNKWPYREDPVLYKLPDYWAIPKKFAKQSGDCEDYSIAKYYTLRELGIPVEQLRIVVLTETIRNIAHAVLAVYLDGKVYILDNLSRYTMEHTRYRNYLPHYSFNEKQRWIHVKPKKKKK